MKLKQFLWALGFDYDDLWPPDALERIETEKEKLTRFLQQRLGALVRLRKSMNALAQKIEDEERTPSRFSLALRHRSRLHGRQERYDRCVAKVRAIQRRITRLDEELRRRRVQKGVRHLCRNGP
jgi:hypothetical protein